MTSAMALSLLQDAQTRGLAAALAGIKREEVDRNLTMSPPMNSNHHHHHHHNQSPVYTGFNHAATAFGMLSPSQLMNRTAAALMAAQLPKLASVASLFPHHPALFGTWRQPSLINGPHSPPASPISPITSQNSLSSSISLSKKLNNNNNNNNMTNNNNIGSTTTNIDIPVTKKTRKISMKKELMSPPLELPISNSSNSGDIYNSGPISPPSSGSSPNSQQGDVPVVVHHGKDPSRDKSFTCKICNRSFGYKHVLQNHERTHTGEKPFECPECHKRFTRDHHLKTHMRLHTGEKPYHCSHCDRQFVQVANLRRHLRVHTGEKPYPCDICKSRFSDSNQLKSHILIHNGEKPFECDRCHLEFRRRHHLMNHKCGIQSPPTPAISPAISDYGMSEQKSTISSSFASDESILDLNKSTGNNSYDDGAILSVSGGGGGNIENEKRSRKSTDIRRVVRLPQQIIHVPTTLPEQTEPEDLSIRSPRSLNSPNSSQHDDDLEDLDDAMTLHFKQQHQLMIQNATAANVVQHIIPKWHTHMEQD